MSHTTHIKLDDKDPDGRKAEGREVLTWLWLVLAVVMIWAVAGFGTFFFAQLFDVRTFVDITKTGTFGDTFGAVNSLFSALGVAGVAYALILQYREQKAAREAAIHARKEAETNRSHDAELAMISALISAHAAMMNYQMGNYGHTPDKLLNHRDKIDVENYGKVLNEQATKLMNTFKTIERLSKLAEEKLGL